MQTSIRITTPEVSVAAPFAYRDILVPTDLSETSNVAVEQAAALARRMNGRLTLFHAVEFPDHEDPHWAFSERPGVWRECDRLAHERLEDLGRGLGVPCTVAVERASSPGGALLDWIARARPDLTVMTTHGRGGLAHLILGSVAEDVVAKSATPLLCVKGSAPLDRALEGCTVLAADFSARSEAALQAASGLAETFGGELVVVCTPHDEPDQPWRPYAAAERWLAGVARHIPVRLLVDTAPMRAAVERVIRAERAGLLVVPRAEADGRTGHAAAMLRHAPCSVLVV